MERNAQKNVDIINELFDDINYSKSKFHVLKRLSQKLLDNNFNLLSKKEDWQNLKSQGKYFFLYNNSLFSFILPKSDVINKIKIVTSHIDSPTFRIKHNGIIFSDESVTLNTESYGGAILSSWLDRPISVAGRIYYSSEDSYNPNFIDVDINEKNFVIPNIAIHLNRDINNGFVYNKQTDMLPLISMAIKNDSNLSQNALIYYIADKYNIDKEQILDYDLFLYAKQEATVAGLNDEFILSPKLDNLQSVFLSNEAMLKSEANESSMILNIFYDNEEIGSRTASGADSNLFEIFIDRLEKCFCVDRFSVTENSFVVSCDSTHAVHPSGGFLSDPTNAPVMNKGIVIKQSASGNYSSDGYTSAILVDICKKNNIPFQFYATKSDKRAGSTLGPMFSAVSGFKTVDIGLALFAMHSTVETGGFDDNVYLKNFLELFFRQ